MVPRLRVSILIVTALIVVVCRLAFEKGNEKVVKPVDTVDRLGARALTLREDSGALPVSEGHDYSFRNRGVVWAPADVEFTWPFRLLQLGKPKVGVKEHRRPPW
jgi:hypothetical protein